MLFAIQESTTWRWSLLDTIAVAWKQSMQTEADWSNMQIVFRISGARPAHLHPLANVNVGNFHGELSYLQKLKESRNQHSSSHEMLSAYLLRINSHMVSEYYHCEKGHCEFRLFCRQGPCITPLSAMASPYQRVGIQTKIHDIQLSACEGNGYACYKDMFTSYKSACSALEKCHEHGSHRHACYFSLPGDGLDISYKLLASASRPIDWHKDLRQQLELLAKEVRQHLKE
jgi:hypothetical protein